MKIENANELKDEINRLAHDLMNPLTVVLGYAQLLSSRTDLPEDVLQQARDIYQQALESASIAEELKRRVAAGENTGICQILILDPEDATFAGIKQAFGTDKGIHHVKSMDDAFKFIISHRIDSVAVNLDLVELDAALVTLNSAKPGVEIVMITKDNELAQNLRSMGYVVLAKSLKKSDILACFKGRPASRTC